MHKILKLHPHKHTGHVLHHRHTSYRALFLVVAIAGAFMVGMNHLAQAADYQVSAVVPAPLPSEAAQMTSPRDGTTFYTPEITISGTCPVISPAILVVLYEDSTMLGSRQCSAAGTFSLPVTFSVGTHSVVATIMNFTGQTGASSPALHLTYIFPTTQPASTTRTTRSQPVSHPSAAAPLTITSTSAFILFGPAQDAIWTGGFSGGTLPYTVTIWWGDGAKQTWPVTGEGQQTYRHTYDALQAYGVKIQLRDSAGQTFTQTITALTPAIFSTYPSTTNPHASQQPVLFWLYLLYGGLIVILLAAWRQEQRRYVRTLAVAPVAGKRHRKSSIKKRR